MPDLDFQIEGAEILRYASAPTLLFKLRIENVEGEPVRSVALKTLIRILTTQRRYASDEQERLVELFGTTERWGETLKAMVWAHTTILVPPFTGSTVVDVTIHCTYDFEVVTAKYFHAVKQGVIPLEFLFSGTVFYAGRVGLQVSQISWEKEAHYPLPAGLWHEMMNLYFPNSAWLRLRQDVFDRLYSYKARQGFATWEDAVERLLRTSEEGMR
ncbi:MAG: DUF6084 family protein [Ktedonobacterales bacterium]